MAPSRRGRCKGHDAGDTTHGRHRRIAEEADKAKAEAIADALGELVGKRLDRPTAHSIGKLFQKRLVGRPAWIGDGQAVATLRKSTGHNANTYQIHVSVPGQDLDASLLKRSPSLIPAIEHSPHSPHSPRRTPATANRGMWGKRGKISPTSQEMM